MTKTYMLTFLIGLMLLSSISFANGNGNTYFYLDCQIKQIESDITVGNQKLDLGVHAQSGEFSIPVIPSISDVAAQIKIEQLGYFDNYLTRMSFQIFDPTDVLNLIESNTILVDAWKGTEAGKSVQSLRITTKNKNSYQLNCSQFSEFEED